MRSYDGSNFFAFFGPFGGASVNVMLLSWLSSSSAVEPCIAAFSAVGVIAVWGDGATCGGTLANSRYREPSFAIAATHAVPSAQRNGQLSASIQSDSKRIDGFEEARLIAIWWMAMISSTVIGSSVAVQKINLAGFSGLKSLNS